MSNFSIKTRNRNWMVTVHTANLVNMGFSEQEIAIPESITQRVIDRWVQSGRNRAAGGVFALSAPPKLTPHIHLVCRGPTTTLRCVSETLGRAHVEPIMAQDRNIIKDYLMKKGKYADSEEQVICEVSIESIEGAQGKRSDLEELSDLLKEGFSPQEVYETNFSYRRYTKMIQEEALSVKKKNLPLFIDLTVEWHFGRPGTHKTKYLSEIATRYGANNIYVVNDYSTGGFDSYMDSLADILFLVELNPYTINYSTLLAILSGVTSYQIHSRYKNVPCLWSKVIISSVYDPHTFYEKCVEYSQRSQEPYFQLEKRITSVVYHFVLNNEYHRYAEPMDIYKHYSGNEFIKEAIRYAKAGLPDPPLELLSLDTIPLEEASTEINLEEF